VLTYFVFFSTHLQFICVLSFFTVSVFCLTSVTLLLFQGEIVYYFTDMSRDYERHYRKEIGANML